MIYDNIKKNNYYFSSHNPIRIKLLFQFFSFPLVVFCNVEHIDFYHTHPSWNACTRMLHHHFSNIQLHSFRIIHMLIQISKILHFQSNLKHNCMCSFSSLKMTNIMFFHLIFYLVFYCMLLHLNVFLILGVHLIFLRC